MPITVTWEDNGDGTGVTATISGSTGAETHTAYIQTLDGPMDSWAFVSAGSRVGNGTLVVAVSGFHHRYISSTVSGITAVTQGIATDGEESVHYQCLTAIKSRLLLLDLGDNIDDTKIIIRKVPSDRGLNNAPGDLPGIVISPINVEIQPDNRGTNARDDIEYPCFVCILAADNQDLITNQNSYLLWRQRINRAFRNQRLPGVDLVDICRVQPGPIASPTSFWQNIYHSSIIVRCLSREPRGV